MLEEYEEDRVSTARVPFICRSATSLLMARHWQGWVTVLLTSVDSEDDLFDEFREWMEDNIGPMVLNHDLTTSDANGMWDYINGEILVKDVSKALIVKLTWGGLLD
jgi:hypothetical protein